MGNIGPIDPITCFSPACCFSGPVQCPAAAPVAYKIQHCRSYSMYNGITGFTDRRAAWARLLRCCWRLPVRARLRRTPAASACAAKSMLMAHAEARWEARSTRQRPILAFRGMDF